jgi:hypothetical protein
VITNPSITRRVPAATSFMLAPGLARVQRLLCDHAKGDPTAAGKLDELAKARELNAAC